MVDLELSKNARGMEKARPLLDVERRRICGFGFDGSHERVWLLSRCHLIAAENELKAAHRVCENW